MNEPWWLILSLTLAALLGGGLLLFRQRRRWRSSTRRLAELLQGARQGEVPIEELSTIEGGLKPLVPVVQDLLRDLKMQKMEMAGLYDEIRQRIAGRTAALERQLGSLRVQATHDGLTGLYNHRMLDSTFPKLLEHSLQQGEDLCVLMMDVDHFKLLNDTRGHSAGDDFLKSLGQLIRSSIRPQDFAFRCGGDEFVVVMPASGRTAGESVAERLTCLVDQLAKTLHSPKPPRLSAGIAVLSDVGERGAHSLLQKADEALYNIKAHRKSLRVA